MPQILVSGVREHLATVGEISRPLARRFSAEYREVMSSKFTSSAAAWPAAKRPGKSPARVARAVLYEMRPVRDTPRTRPTAWPNWCAAIR